MFKIAVLVSGGGSNLQSIIDNIHKGQLHCEIEAVISDREEAAALIKARKNSIPTYVIDKKSHGNNFSERLLEILEGKVDLIILAGFLSILQGEILEKFRHKIINIHPSLIPSFCGKGMYGIKVHEEVIKYGVRISGCTVHFVDETIDGGAIILQKSVEINPKDTPKKLQEKILDKEHELLPEAIDLFIKKRITIVNGRIVID